MDSMAIEMKVINLQFILMISGITFVLSEQMDFLWVFIWNVRMNKETKIWQCSQL